MFTGLRLQNFKSWRDTGEIRFAPLTGFFGTNSSGKSSLLQIFLIWKQTSETVDRKTILQIGGSYTDGGSFKDVIFQHNEQNNLKIELNYKWLSPETVWYEEEAISIGDLYKINFSSVIGFNNSIPFLKKMLHTFYLDSQTKASAEIGLIFNEQKQKYEIIPSLKANISIIPYKSYGFFWTKGIEDALNTETEAGTIFVYQDMVIKAFEETFQKTFYLGPLRKHPARTYIWSGGEPQDVGIEGENTVPALMISQIQPERKQVQEKVAYWLKELGLIDHFELKPIAPGRREYEILVQINPESTPVPLTDVGFGVSQILPVLTLCYYVPEESTLILEQPEIHLHPAVQSGLADVFIDVIKNRRLQIILESHSEHLLRRLQRRMAEEKLLPEETALYFTYMEQGESHLQPLEIDDYGNIHNWPKNFFGNELDDMGAMMEAALQRKLRQNGGN